jgi:hypothetical protein
VVPPAIAFTAGLIVGTEGWVGRAVSGCGAPWRVAEAALALDGVNPLTGEAPDEGSTLAAVGRKARETSAKSRNIRTAETALTTTKSLQSPCLGHATGQL